jgi:hypothetical protein
MGQKLINRLIKLYNLVEIAYKGKIKPFRVKITNKGLLFIENSKQG